MSQTRLIDKAPIYVELYEALAHFWGRERLVIRAIIDQGVDPTKLPQQGVGAWHDKTPQIGKWGDEWEFFFHGGGCQITHVKTKEPIDWNGPSPDGFDPLAFIAHVEWRLKLSRDLPLIRRFIKHNNSFDIPKLVDDLVADGILTADYCFWPSNPEPSQASNP